MKIRVKLTILLCALSLVVASAIVMHRNYEVKRLWSLFKASRAEKELVFDKIADLKGAQLKSFVNDYSFWDEMVNFISTGDLKWAELNIDTSLATYDADVVWVYAPDGSRVYATDSVNGSAINAAFPPMVIKKLFASGKFCHFFVDMPQGPLEIRGAAVNPTFDIERKSPARGYFLAGCFWDDAFLRNLSLLTGSSIRFASTLEREPSLARANMARGEIGFLRELKGWNGKPVAKIAILFRSDSIKHFNEGGQTVFYLFLALSGALLVIILLFTIRWVTSPLKLISSALSEGSPSYVDSIRSNKDEFGDIARIVSKFFEQTDQLKAEGVKLRKIELREKAILDNIPDMAWLKDKEGRFIAVNETFAKMCGLKAGQLAGKTDFDVWPKEQALAYIADDKEVMLSGKHKVVTEPLFSPGGEMSWIETVKTPIHNEKGEVIGTTGIARDVTARKRSEEEAKKAYVELKETQHRLIQAEKFAALGKFSSSFAHEIKNPLGIILNGTEFLEMRLRDSDAEIKEDLDIIKKSTLRADAIIQRLLKFARPAEAKLEKIAPDTLVKDTLSFFKYTAPAGEIRINTEFSPEKMEVAVDKNQIQQALINLVLNAAEAMPRGGDIVIRTYKIEQSEFYFAKPAAVIEVADNGSGISEENMTKIFEPFFTTKSEKGTGLGLFITKMIIDNNKGNIVIDSKLGKGTSIKINLPLV